MQPNTKIAIFRGKGIRKQWDDVQEKWYFAVVDVIEVLTGSPNPRSYWKVLKYRLKKEGSEVVTKCNHLKMRASDGKEYVTDAADTEILLRLVQSIPSPNVEPFKLWLARVGYEMKTKKLLIPAVPYPVVQEKTLSAGQVNR